MAEQKKQKLSPEEYRRIRCENIMKATKGAGSSTPRIKPALDALNEAKAALASVWSGTQSIVKASIMSHTPVRGATLDGHEYTVEEFYAYDYDDMLAQVTDTLKGFQNDVENMCVACEALKNELASDLRKNRKSMSEDEFYEKKVLLNAYIKTFDGLYDVLGIIASSKSFDFAVKYVPIEHGKTEKDVGDISGDIEDVIRGKAEKRGMIVNLNDTTQVSIDDMTDFGGEVKPIKTEVTVPKWDTKSLARKANRQAKLAVRQAKRAERQAKRANRPAKKRRRR